MKPKIKNPKKVVVIGGGFAGINIIKSLAGSEEFSVTLVDKNNYNFFPPLIYQVATGFLDIASISLPFRKLLRQYKNVRFFYGRMHRSSSGSKQSHPFHR